MVEDDTNRAKVTPPPEVTPLLSSPPPDEKKKKQRAVASRKSMYMFLGKNMPSEKDPIPVTIPVCENQSEFEQQKSNPFSCKTDTETRKKSLENEVMAEQVIAPRTAEKGRHRTKRASRKGKAGAGTGARAGNNDPHSNDLDPQFRDVALGEIQMQIQNQIQGQGEGAAFGCEDGNGVLERTFRKQKTSRRSGGEEEPTSKAGVAV